MKLVLVIPGGLDPGRRERIIPALLWLVERLAQRHEVHVFATDSPFAPRSYRLGSAAVHELQHARWPLPGGRMLGVWHQLTTALKRISQGGPITAMHGFWAGASGMLAALAGKRIGVPVVVSIGGGELVWLPEVGYGGQGRLRSRVQALLALRLANAVTGGSRYALAPLNTRVPTHCVPLGVDFAQFAAPITRFPGPPWKVIHVGSLNRIKDQTTLLHALRLIVAQEPSVHLDLVGEDTLSGAVQRLCVKLDLAKHVSFHGFQTSDEVAALYRTAHLHLLSSRHESQAVVVGEAAAAGVPTVGTAVGVIAELAPVTATAVPVGDAHALAEATLEVLHNPTKRERMAVAAQRWSAQHDVDWTARQFEQIYHDIARKH